MFAGYIFDVEGTLVDSVPQNLRSLQKALDRAGLQVPYATLQLYSGLDGDQTLQIIEPGLGEAQRRQILQSIMIITSRAYDPSHVAFSSVTNNNDASTSADIPSSHVSSRQEAYDPATGRSRPSSSIMNSSPLCANGNKIAALYLQSLVWLA